MATPSVLNGVVKFNSADLFLTGTVMATAFFVNASKTNWVIDLQDKNSQTIFKANGSAAESLSFTLANPLPIVNPSVVTITNVSDLLIYTL